MIGRRHKMEREIPADINGNLDSPPVHKSRVARFPFGCIEQHLLRFEKLLDRYVSSCFGFNDPAVPAEQQPTGRVAGLVYDHEVDAADTAHGLGFCDPFDKLQAPSVMFMLHAQRS